MTVERTTPKQRAEMTRLYDKCLTALVDGTYRFHPEWSDQRVATEVGVQSRHAIYFRKTTYGELAEAEKPKSVEDRLLDLERRVAELEHHLTQPRRGEI